MSLKEKNKVPNVTYILNIAAGVMFVFSIFNIYISYKYIEGLIVQGFQPSKQIAEVINYYLGAVTPYVFYGICLLALGYIIAKINSLENNDSIDEKMQATKKVVVENKKVNEIESLLNDLED